MYKLIIVIYHDQIRQLLLLLILTLLVNCSQDNMLMTDDKADNLYCCICLVECVYKLNISPAVTIATFLADPAIMLP